MGEFNHSKPHLDDRGVQLEVDENE